MEKLYYKNVYIKDFTAEVINIIEKAGKYHVELDKTCFYPEGGGQPSDIGFIESIPVIYVYEENGIVYHVVEKKPMKIHRVKCSIDWEKRYDNMQQHLGQHILSAALIDLFNANTIGFHLGQNYTTIDIDKALGQSEIKKAEDMANKIVLDNIKVEVLYPTKSELKKLPLRKTLPKTNEEIRIVRIGDIDVNACCGTHPSSTIEVQMIKVTRWEKYKNGIRIYFLCGSRTATDYISKHEAIERMSTLLNCNTSNVLGEVERLTSELNKALAEVGSLRAEVADYKVQDMLNSCENIDGIRIVKAIYDNTNIKQLNLLASKLAASPKVIVLFALKSQDKAQLLFMCSKDLNVINMGSLLKDAITLIDGKGGGSEFSAQGGGKNNNNLESCLEYAHNKVKNDLI